MALDTPGTLSNKNWVYKQGKSREKFMKLGDRLNWRLKDGTAHDCSNLNKLRHDSHIFNKNIPLIDIKR